MESIPLQPVFLMYAFRYALGRMSYAVSDVADALVANKDSLPDDWKEQIIRDIEDAESMDRIGMDNDAEHWLAVRDVMRQSLNQLRI